MEDIPVKSAVTHKQYYIKDMVRIVNPKQIALYMKSGLTLYDIYPSETLDGATVIVGLFDRAESKYAYDLWLKHELR